VKFLKSQNYDNIKNFPNLDEMARGWYWFIPWKRGWTWVFYL